MLSAPAVYPALSYLQQLSIPAVYSKRKNITCSPAGTRCQNSLIRAVVKEKKMLTLFDLKTNVGRKFTQQKQLSRLHRLQKIPQQYQGRTTWFQLSRFQIKYIEIKAKPMTTCTWAVNSQSRRSFELQHPGISSFCSLK